jgi:hypothetical protein
MKKVTSMNEKQWNCVLDQIMHFPNSCCDISHTRQAYDRPTLMPIDYRHNTHSRKYLPTHLNGYLAYQEMFQVNVADIKETVLYQA